MIKLLTVPFTGTHLMHGLFHYYNIQYMHRHFSMATFHDADENTMITLRDPILARISLLNRGQDTFQCPVWLWRQVMQLDGKVHFVRIQNSREDELGRILEKCKNKTVMETPFEWKVYSSVEDKYGFKEEYLRSGLIPGRLREDVKVLHNIGARDFFKRHGYNFPWM